MSSKFYNDKQTGSATTWQGAQVTTIFGDMESSTSVQTPHTGVIEAQDFITAYDTTPVSLNGFITTSTNNIINVENKTENITSATQLPDITNFSGLINSDELTANRLYDSTQSVFIEMDGTDIDVNATNFNFNGFPIASYDQSLNTTDDVTFDGITLTSNNVELGANSNAGTTGIALGYNAGSGANGIAIGSNCGLTNQGINSVAIGMQCGTTNLGQNTTCIGHLSGETNAGNFSTSLGSLSNNQSAGVGSVAIGYGASASNSGDYSVSIGLSAAENQSDDNTIMISSSGVGTATFADNDIILTTGLTTIKASVASGLEYNGVVVGSDKLPLAGGTMTGDINLNSNDILNGNTIQTVNVDLTTNVTSLGVGATKAINSVNIGNAAGGNASAELNVCIGALAGSSMTATSTENVLIGTNADCVGNNNICMGEYSKVDVSGNDNVLIGRICGASSSGFSGCTVVGSAAGVTGLTNNCLLIGQNAGQDCTGFTNPIILNSTGTIINPDANNQIKIVTDSTSIITDSTKFQAPKINLENLNVSIGSDSGDTNMGLNANVAIGNGAGSLNMGLTTGHSVAIGNYSGEEDMGYQSVAIGDSAGQTNMGNGSIACGTACGFTNMGDYSVAIGYGAGVTNMHANCIAINADYISDLDTTQTEQILLKAGNTLLSMNPTELNTNGKNITASTSYASIYFSNNAVSTVITTMNVWTKVLGTTTPFAGNNRFTATNNRLTYTGTQTKNFKITNHFSFTPSTGLNRNWGFSIYKNGTALIPGSESGVFSTISTADVPGHTECLVSLATNDYIELWVRNTDGTNNLTVTVMNLIITPLFN